MGRLSKSVSPHFRAILAGNRSEEVVGWCRTRSPEAHLQDLCGGGRATPVLLSNNAEDRLFAPDAALLYRQALHGAGCRVETMIHEGIHAMAELPGMLGFSDAVATSSPLWSRVLAFLDANLKPGAAPPPPPPARSGVLVQAGEWGARTSRRLNKTSIDTCSLCTGTS
mmetsp:Transcript_9827/g.32238  ORF Transcript_9827/g.32238 Transcript_9827/m.32238 type:complete len:168 (+) Transcript_9827:436-939(+)